jgi:hypothetical protein
MGVAYHPPIFTFGVVPTLLIFRPTHKLGGMLSVPVETSRPLRLRTAAPIGAPALRQSSIKR